MTDRNDVVSELEKERQTAIFVIQNFVPEEQRTKIDLNFIMQQLKPSPIPPQFNNIQSNSEAHQNSTLEDSEDWQDLMQWNSPSLLDTIESRQVHLFQWYTSYNFLDELKTGLQGHSTNPSKLESQKNEIKNIIQIIRGMRTKVSFVNNNNNTTTTTDKLRNVCEILWKLRGVLATIPTPVTKVACVNAHVRLVKFHEELGIVSFTKLNHWIVKNPDQYLLYLATVCWLVPAVGPRLTMARNEA